MLEPPDPLLSELHSVVILQGVTIVPSDPFANDANIDLCASWWLAGPNVLYRDPHNKQRLTLRRYAPLSSKEIQRQKKTKRPTKKGPTPQYQNARARRRHEPRFIAVAIALRPTCPLFDRFVVTPLQVRAMFLCHWAALLNVPHDALCCVADYRFAAKVCAVTHEVKVSYPEGWKQKDTNTVFYVLNSLLPPLTKTVTSSEDFMRETMVNIEWGHFYRLMTTSYGLRRFFVRVTGCWQEVSSEDAEIEFMLPLAEEFGLTLREAKDVFRDLGVNLNHKMNSW